MVRLRTVNAWNAKASWVRSLPLEPFYLCSSVNRAVVFETTCRGFESCQGYQQGPLITVRPMVGKVSGVKSPPPNLGVRC